MKLNEIADPELGVIDLEQQKDDVRRPSMYAVILHNDDYTPAELVAELLKKFFGKSLQDAVAIMMEAHTQDKARVGIYPKDVAETKISNAMAFAHAHEFPLLLTSEPTEDKE